MVCTPFRESLAKTLQCLNNWGLCVCSPSTYAYNIILIVQVMDGVLDNRAAQAVVVISTKPGCFIAGADVKLVSLSSFHLSSVTGQCFLLLATCMYVCMH